MDNFKYVLLLDVDEIIMPQIENVKTLPELMSKLDNDTINSFNVQNVFMFSNGKEAEDKNAEKFGENLLGAEF